MKPKKKVHGLVRGGLALGTFALLLAGTQPTKAQNCLTITLDCGNCGGGISQLQCCASASCFFVETRNGNCNTPAVCETKCSDGTVHENIVSLLVKLLVEKEA